MLTGYMEKCGAESPGFLCYAAALATSKGVSQSLCKPSN